MLTVMVRAAILFLVVLLAMRMMGKRQVGQLLPFELVVAVMIADLVSTPMETIGKPILQGIVPALTLVIMHSILSMLSLKNQKLRAFISGRPSILVHKGVLQEAELRDLCYNLSELLEELRAKGILSPAQAGTAILETSGKISVFPHSDHRPVTLTDMGLSSGYEGIPLPLVMDGVVQGENITLAGLDQNWLDGRLKELGFRSAAEVFLASLDTKGMLLVQGKGPKPRLVTLQALGEEAVVW